MAVSPELLVLHGVNATYKSQDLLHQPGLERASTGMPDQRTTCAATQGIILPGYYLRRYKMSDIIGIPLSTLISKYRSHQIVADRTFRRSNFMKRREHIPNIAW